MKYVLPSFFTFAAVCMFPITDAGRASMKKPDLPDGFCPPETGDITDTTGECMCHWQHKNGCVGSKCEYQMGLSWYHYTCEDCKCVAEPK
mmetsp:Transcript_16834/g.23059  ORF Transcript_16834/g.23059 Transcript_16834/m.23059 type:complete len:90 (+) Transcript_16834:76-345(+)